MQDTVAERAFYDALFESNPENEHITSGYDELHELAFPDLPTGAVLDLGCGTGAHAVRMARRGFEIVAVDLTKQGVRSARDRFRREGLDGLFVVANAEDLPFRDGMAAVTWTSLLLHHFLRLDRLESELGRVTKQRLIAFETNAGNFVTWFAMNVVNRFVGISGMTRNQRALRPRSLRRRFGRLGFQQRALHYIHRPWADRLSFVRHFYITVTGWLPLWMQANKFLIIFEKRSA